MGRARGPEPPVRVRLRPASQSLKCLELGSRVAALINGQQSNQPALPQPIYVSRQGWAQRLISPAQALLLLTGPGDGNSEFKDQLCPWGRQIEQANRKLRGCRARIKGSNRGGGGGYRLQVPRVGVSCTGPSPPWGLCACHCPLCHRSGERKEGGKTQRLPRPAGTPPLKSVFSLLALAFQGDYLTPTLPQLHKGSRGFSHQGCPISLTPTLALGPRRPPRLESKGTLCLEAA